MNLVQIGTNIANDDFYRIVTKLNKEDIKNLILVEPLKSCNLNIENCYKNYKYILENVVINLDSSVHSETFFVSKYNWLSSLTKEHIEKHKTNETPTEIKIDAITLDNLFRKYNLTEVDILFIDCEGKDDEIIKSINFDEFNIKNIYYEHAHINNEELIQFLNKKNYTVNKTNFSDGLTSLAVKLN